MGKMSREKGKRFERFVANLFKDWGYEAHRTAQYKGNTGQAGDVEGVDGIHIECKAQERMNLYEWIEQAERDARAEGKGNFPVVIHKANNKPILVTMPFPFWIQMFNEWHSVKKLQEKWGLSDGEIKNEAHEITE